MSVDAFLEVIQTDIASPGGINPGLSKMRNGYRISDYESAKASDGAAETPMHGNAWVGNHRAVRRLLRKGRNVNVLDSTENLRCMGRALRAEPPW